MAIKLEAFTAEPPCAGCTNLIKLVDEIAQDYGDSVEVVKHIGPSEEFKKYKLTLVPAIVMEEGKIVIMGVCPDKETIISSLKEVGL